MKKENDRIKNIGEEKALQKIMTYCAYQERNQQEVRDKLYSFGLYPLQVEQLLSTLVEENFLNEERFAIAFAGGKFRINQWGKIKIRSALKQKHISDYCIRKALSLIPDTDYINTLEKLFGSRLRALNKEKNVLVKKRKLQAYLLQKGFEKELVNALLLKM